MSTAEKIKLLIWKYLQLSQALFSKGSFQDDLYKLRSLDQILFQCYALGKKVTLLHSLCAKAC